MTDVAKTFARIRREQAAVAKVKASASVAPIVYGVRNIGGKK